MFETLLKKIQIKTHNFGFELARAHDPYRMRHLLSSHIEDLQNLWKAADDMVRELEE